MSSRGRYYRKAPPSMTDKTAAIELVRTGQWCLVCPADEGCQPIQGGPDGLQAHLATVHPDWKDPSP